MLLHNFPLISKYFPILKLFEPKPILFQFLTTFIKRLCKERLKKTILKVFKQLHLVTYHWTFMKNGHWEILGASILAKNFLWYCRHFCLWDRKLSYQKERVKSWLDVDLMLKMQEVFLILRVEEHFFHQIFGHFLLINQLKCNYFEQILYYEFLIRSNEFQQKKQPKSSKNGWFRPKTEMGESAA